VETMSKIIGIIPARMESSRFPGKPLAKINGIPMIGHVYFRSKMSDLLDAVYVATCNNEIIEYVESIHGKAIMTSDKHKRASDRIAEAQALKASGVFHKGNDFRIAASHIDSQFLDVR
jgi:3-deoxy-manno-octulosonate cytidylyltransferase (CMP-KDO synthetase)